MYMVHQWYQLLAEYNYPISNNITLAFSSQNPKMKKMSPLCTPGLCDQPYKIFGQFEMGSPDLLNWSSYELHVQSGLTQVHSGIGDLSILVRPKYICYNGGIHSPPTADVCMTRLSWVQHDCTLLSLVPLYYILSHFVIMT